MTHSSPRATLNSCKCYLQIPPQQHRSGEGPGQVHGYSLWKVRTKVIQRLAKTCVTTPTGGRARYGKPGIGVILEHGMVQIEMAESFEAHQTHDMSLRAVENVHWFALPGGTHTHTHTK